MLDFQVHGPKAVQYGYIDDDTHEVVPVLHMTFIDYEDFGKPAKITVTIRPGDLLNVE